MDNKTTRVSLLRRIQRLSIRQYILVAVLAAISFVSFLDLYENHDQESPPIVWQQYSPAAIEACLESEKPAMVFVFANWDLNSEYMKNTTLKSSLVEHAIRSHDVSLFSADYSRLNKTEDDSVVSLVQELSPRGAVPFIAIFQVRQHYKPVVFLSVVSEAELANALAASSSSENQR